MIVGIDASNIWAGDTVIYLVELIAKSNPSAYGSEPILNKSLHLVLRANENGACGLFCNFHGAG
jgi:hypothetical protein